MDSARAVREDYSVSRTRKEVSMTLTTVRLLCARTTAFEPVGDRKE
jgi:hypothetical protein